MIETISLRPGITLRCCRDDRFKQGCLTVQLLRPMCAEEAALNALLPAVLLRGTEVHPDLRSITQALDDLYGASVSTLVRRIGDIQTVGLYCGFLEDRFALPGDRILEPFIALLEELLFRSPLENGGFLPQFVESEKRNLVATVESELNNKQAYAMTRMVRSMCEGDSFAVPRLGEKAAIEAITPRSLREHYDRILSSSPIEFFFVGSAESHQVAALLEPLLNRLPQGERIIPAQLPLKTNAPADFSETMDLAQGKLCMGFVTPITNRHEDFISMQVLNTLFGGGMTSKLFQNVREKLSLCYSVGSSYHGSKGLITVAAGIDFDKEQLCREEIIQQLSACQEGHISDAELNAAKEALLSALRASLDSPGAIEGYYSTAAISGSGRTVEAYADAIALVTPEQVVAAAKSVQLHTVFFLKGGG